MKLAQLYQTSCAVVISICIHVFMPLLLSVKSEQRMAVLQDWCREEGFGRKALRDWRALVGLGLYFASCIVFALGGVAASVVGRVMKREVSDGHFWSYSTLLGRFILAIILFWISALLLRRFYQSELSKVIGRYKNCVEECEQDQSASK